MAAEKIEYKTQDEWLKLRSENINSSDVAALFGLSPYSTEFELAHRIKNKNILELTPNNRMVWGNRLESAIAHGIAEDEGLSIEPMKYYMRDSKKRMGSSFDFEIVKPEEGILEIKNVDFLQFRDKWVIEDGEVEEAPAHIEMQVQHQMALSEKDFTIIGALIGGNEVATIRRERDDNIIKKMESKIDEFWGKLDAGIMPEPDFKKDAEFLIQLYGSANKEEIYDATGNEHIAMLVEKYKQFAEFEKEGANGKKTVKAELLTIIGQAGKVLGEGFSISAGEIHRKEHMVKASSYRGFRVNKKKAK